MRFLALILSLLTFMSTQSASASKIFTGPYDARLLYVVDGDTVAVRAQIWPNITSRVLVRIYGIDTPELRGKCAAEKSLAKEAKAFVIYMLGSSDKKGESGIGVPVQLRNVQLGKFAGRIVADVFYKDNSIGEMMVATGRAREYTGGTRKGWCP